MIDTLDLIPGRADQEAVHGFRNRIQGTGNGTAHIVHKAVRQGFVDALEHEVAVLVLDDHLDIVIQGPGHS